MDADEKKKYTFLQAINTIRNEKYLSERRAMLGDRWKEQRSQQRNQR
jgi:hypothetical protein